jgi:hypothetical protein
MQSVVDTHSGLPTVLRIPIRKEPKLLAGSGSDLEPKKLCKRSLNTGRKKVVSYDYTEFTFTSSCSVVRSVTDPDPQIRASYQWIRIQILQTYCAPCLQPSHEAVTIEVVIL